MKHIISIFLILISCMCINAEVRIHMEKEAEVYKVPCSVNGLKLKFIFDTGASSVCISQTYAKMMLENGYLDESDILGKSQSTIADGSNIDNVVINLRNVEIGGLSLENVLAVVVPTQNAPLLLGQSVIQRLGLVSIDGEFLVIHNARKQYTEEDLDEIFAMAEDMYNNEIYSEALKYYKSVYESYGNDTHPLVLFKMGICYFDGLKDPVSAKRCYLKAIELEDENNEDEILYALYRNVANICFWDEDYLNGLEYSKLSLKYATNLKEKICANMFIGGEYLTFFHQYNKSIEHYDQAIVLYKQIQQSRELGSDELDEFIESYTSKGYALEELYRFDEAIQQYEEAKRINDKYYKNDITDGVIKRLLSECKERRSKNR